MKSNQIEMRTCEKERELVIFVGGVRGEENDESLEEYFGRFGEVKCRAEMWEKRGRKKCRGFGFVYCRDEETFNKILREEKHVIGGREVECKKAYRGEQEAAEEGEAKKRRRVFVRQLPLSSSPESFKRVFQQFGEVEMAYTTQDRKGEGVLGFVTFKKEADALSALNHPHPVTYQGHTLLLSPYLTKREVRHSGGGPYHLQPNLSTQGALSDLQRPSPSTPSLLDDLDISMEEGTCPPIFIAPSIPPKTSRINSKTFLQPTSPPQKFYTWNLPRSEGSRLLHQLSASLPYLPRQSTHPQDPKVLRLSMGSPQILSFLHQMNSSTSNLRFRIGPLRNLKFQPGSNLPPLKRNHESISSFN